MNRRTPKMYASAYDSMNDRTQLTATVAGTADFLNAYSFDALQRLTQETQMGQTAACTMVQRP